MTTTETPKLIRAAQAGIILLSLGSFAISFVQIKSAAESVGTITALAVVYGCLAEGFIALATYTAWVARGSKLQIYPWSVALAGFSFSLWANARTSSDVGQAVIHGVPVLALPLGVHMIIVLMEAHNRSTEKARASQVVLDAEQTAAQVLADAEAHLAVVMAEIEAQRAEAATERQSQEAEAERLTEDASAFGRKTFEDATDRAAEILAEAEKTLRDAEEKAASLAPAIEYVEVPAEITPDTVDASTVANPRAVAYKLLSQVAERPQTRSYAEKRFREAMADFSATVSG